MTLLHSSEFTAIHLSRMGLSARSPAVIYTYDAAIGRDVTPRFHAAGIHRRRLMAARHRR